MTEINSQWHRLSPIAVVFFLVKTLSQLFKESLAGLAPLAIVIANSDEKLKSFSLILAAIGFLLILVSFLQYWFFRFKMEPTQILINEGVLKKKNRTIDYSRIQNINILEPLYFRPFSLVTLQIETAGSSANEANLAGIKLSVAESIKTNAHKSSNARAEDNPPANALASQTLAKASTLDAIKYGLTSNNMFWFLAILSPFLGKIDDLIENSIGKKNLDLVIDQLGGGAVGVTILILISLIVIIFMMLLFSILGAVVRYYDYFLTQQENTLKRKSGLFSTHEETTKRSKIQAVVHQTNFIGRWLNIENLIFKQATGQHKHKNNRNNLFIVPSRTLDQSTKLVANVFSEATQEYELQAIDSRYKTKSWLLLMLPVTLATGILAIKIHISFLFLWPIAAIVGRLMVYQRWKMYRYALTEQFGFFQRGFLGYRKIEFPLFKAQRVLIKQSPLQRKRNLATLVIFLASERIQIPYIKMQEAENWFNQISFQIESTAKNWY